MQLCKKEVANIDFLVKKLQEIYQVYHVPLIIVKQYIYEYIYISVSARVTCNTTKRVRRPTPSARDNSIPTVPYDVSNTSKTGKTITIIVYS